MAIVLGCAKPAPATAKRNARGIDAAEVPAPKPGLFRLSSVGNGKGMGIVAEQDIDVGTVICVDWPVLVLEGKDIGVVDVVQSTQKDRKVKWLRGPSHLRALFNQLPQADQAKYADLSDCYNLPTAEARDGRQLIEALLSKSLGLSAEDIEKALDVDGDGILASKSKSLWGIFETNCLPQGEQNAQGVYPTISRFNHSCLPNAIYQWREPLGTNVVVTTCPVSAGEEITVSYFRSLFMTSEERQKRTLMTWGFKCGCQACQLPACLLDLKGRVATMTEEELGAQSEAIAAAQKRSDSNQRRQELWQLEKVMERAASLEQGLVLLERMQALFEAEDMLPNLVIEKKLAWDFLMLHTVYNSHDHSTCRDATERLCAVSTKLGGDDNPAQVWLKSARGIPTLQQILTAG